MGIRVVMRGKGVRTGKKKKKEERAKRGERGRGRGVRRDKVNDQDAVFGDDWGGSSERECPLSNRIEQSTNRAHGIEYVPKKRPRTCQKALETVCKRH